MSDVVFDEAKIEMIKSNANMFLTFNVAGNNKTGYMYCVLEDLAEMIDPAAEGSDIVKYRREKDTLSEEDRRMLYDNCSLIPKLAYIMSDYIKEAFDALEAKRHELFTLTGLDSCFPESKSDESFNGIGISREEFWKNVDALSEEFPVRPDIPTEIVMRAGGEYAIRLYERLTQELASKEVIPNEVLITNIKTLIGNNS